MFKMFYNKFKVLLNVNGTFCSKYSVTIDFTTNQSMVLPLHLIVNLLFKHNQSLKIWIRTKETLNKQLIQCISEWIKTVMIQSKHLTLAYTIKIFTTVFRSIHYIVQSCNPLKVINLELAHQKVSRLNTLLNLK